MSFRAFIIAAMVFACCLVSITSAGCDACSAEPEGGWGAPDYSDDPTWGSSLDDLTDYYSGPSEDSGSGDSDSTDGSGSDTPSGSSGGSSYDPGTGEGSSGSGSVSYGSGGSVENGLLWRMKGDALSREGLYNESADAYAKAVEYDPYALKSWTGFGKVLLELGRPEKAAEAFKRAAKLDPTDATLYVSLGDAWAAGADYDAAIENYRKALAMHPGIAGVAEKILLAEQALAGTPGEPGIPGETVTESLGSTPPPSDPPQTTPHGISTESVQPPASSQAAFPGILAGFAAIAAFLMMRGTKKN